MTGRNLRKNLVLNLDAYNVKKLKNVSFQRDKELSSLIILIKLRKLFPKDTTSIET